jgi:ABC-2 type transport system ATP-binding protein
MVTAGADPGPTPVIPAAKQRAPVRHSDWISAAAALAVVPVLAIAPLVSGSDFDPTLGLGLILLPGLALLGVRRVMVASFTGEGVAQEALFLGLVSFPLTLLAFLIVVPDQGNTGRRDRLLLLIRRLVAARQLLFLRHRRLSLRAALLPRMKTSSTTLGLGGEDWTSSADASRRLGSLDQMPNDPVVIDVKGAEKAFRIPVHRIDSFKERVVHPLARPEYRVLHALRGVSFDVRRGEFFGIVGRNGSGKSTLLKILASIYRADSGSIRMAGQPAPFIELGVGFNPDLSARENVVLNGVLMGLTQRESRRRLDAVLDFAELEDFVDLKLKNYSSGMLVRLAFSMMIQSEAEILLIDEVLAVGDAAFRQKCADVFRKIRAGDRTVVLVTHDMTAVQAFCHRAMLLDEGTLTFIGDPTEAGRRYLRTSFAKRRVSIGGEPEVELVADLLARISQAWLEDASGQRITNVEVGEPIRLRARLEALCDLSNPRVGLKVINADGVEVFGIERVLGRQGSETRLESGGTADVSATIQNPLLPGRYSIVGWVAVMRNSEVMAQQLVKYTDFVVFGMEGGAGIVSVEGELDLEVAPARTPEPR